MRSPIALVAVIAFSLVLAGIESELTVGCQGWHQFQAEIDEMHSFGMEDVRIFGVPPKQNRPFLFGSLIDFVLTDSHGSDLEGSVRSNDGIGRIDFIPRLGEILAIRNRPWEEFNRIPSREFCRAGSTIILEGGDECLECRFIVFVIGNYELAAGKLYDRSELFTSIDLSVIRDFPLLVNEEKSHRISEKQQRSESSDHTSPFDHLPVKVLGVLFLLVGMTLGWWSICHDIPPSKPDPVARDCVGPYMFCRSNNWRPKSPPILPVRVLEPQYTPERISL
jgi:hypothetical protein